MADYDERPAFDLARLTEAELSLLELVFSPLHEQMGDGWPIWGWVEDRFETAHPRLSAARVLAGLPTIRPSHQGSRPYGLVWRTDYNTPEPLPSEHIGLTIVGLGYLAVKDESLQLIANGLVEIIRDIAALDRRVSPHPTTMSSHQQALSFFSQPLTNDAARRHISLPMELIAEVLRHEYSNPLVLSPSNGSWLVSLDGRRLRRHRLINDLDDYLLLIADLDGRFHEDDPKPRHLLPPEVFDSGSSGDARWRALDERIADMERRLLDSTTGADWSDVALRCSQILIDIGYVIRDDMEAPNTPPKDDDAKSWLRLYLKTKGSRTDMSPLIEKAWVLAQSIKHGGAATRADVFACAQATVLIARVIQSAHTQ